MHIFITLFFITFSHLSYNKSAKFFVLNVYFAEDNHGEKEDRSIWLEEDDPKFNWLNSVFGELSG